MARSLCSRRAEPCGGTCYGGRIGKGALLRPSESRAGVPSIRCVTRAQDRGAEIEMHSHFLFQRGFPL